jgi:hypothetical protein
MRREPTAEELILFVRQRLDTASTEKIMTHLATGCKACSSQVEWARTVLEAANQDPAEDLPEVIRGAAQRIYDDHLRRRKERDPRISHAILMFDSAWVPLPAGARAPASGQRRLVFSAEPYEVDLEISRIRRGAFSVLGQVLPTEHLPPCSEATLQRRGRRTIPLDAQGLFAFESVAPGIVGLMFQLGSQTIRLSRVRIG